MPNTLKEEKPFTGENGISFEGHKKLMELVDTDFYTGNIVPKNLRNTEHILPKSKGGANKIYNYAMADRYINSECGNIPLEEWGLKKILHSWKI